MTANYDDTVPPLLVELVKDNTKEKRPTELRTAHRTLVLTLANPFQQIAGYDPARREVRINVLDNPSVLSGDISQASDAANTGSPISAPNGRLLNINTEFVIPGQDEMWISTGTYPTKIAYTIVRCI